MRQDITRVAITLTAIAVTLGCSSQHEHTSLAIVKHASHNCTNTRQSYTTFQLPNRELFWKYGSYGQVGDTVRLSGFNPELERNCDAKEGHKSL